jgi:hypothetical protein
MSNTIDSKEIKLDNTMFNYVFLWKAKLYDNTCFYQEDGADYNKQVKNNINLKEFSLYSKDLQKIFIVNLEHGYISSSKLNIQSDDKKLNIRLIYFRKGTLITDFKTQNLSYVQNLGLQWNDIKGNNHKIIMQILENGDFLIEGE